MTCTLCMGPSLVGVKALGWCCCTTGGRLIWRLARCLRRRLRASDHHRPRVPASRCRADYPGGAGRAAPRGNDPRPALPIPRLRRPRGLLRLPSPPALERGGCYLAPQPDHAVRVPPHPTPPVRAGHHPPPARPHRDHPRPRPPPHRQDRPGSLEPFVPRTPVPSTRVPGPRPSTHVPRSVALASPGTFSNGCGLRRLATPAPGRRL